MDTGAKSFHGSVGQEVAGDIHQRPLENLQPIPTGFLSEILDHAVDDLSDRLPCFGNNTAAAGVVNPELVRDKSGPLLKGLCI